MPSKPGSPNFKALPNFPYKDLHLDDAQARELFARIQKNRDLLTDAIALGGHLMQMDDASVANIAAHYALAGVGYLGDDARFIWGKRSAPDDSGMWRTEVEWLVIKDHPVEAQHEATEAEVAALRAQLVKQVPAGLLDALKASLAAEYEDEMETIDSAGHRLKTEGEN